MHHMGVLTEPRPPSHVAVLDAINQPGSDMSKETRAQRVKKGVKLPWQMHARALTAHDAVFQRWRVG
jgi:hypothetical protein